MNDEPKWCVMKTLLGCEPGSDVNRRIIYHENRPIATFNKQMAEWHEEDNAALSRLCDYLNNLEQTRFR